MDERQPYKLVLEHSEKKKILFCNIILPHSCWIISPWPGAVQFIDLLQMSYAIFWIASFMNNSVPFKAFSCIFSFYMY